MIEDAARARADAFAGQRHSVRLPRESGACASSGAGGVPSSGSGEIETGTRYASEAHAPRSISRQRSEQNGRHRDFGVHSTGVPQCGQATMRGEAMGR
jgi:hypothetical protein